MRKGRLRATARRFVICPLAIPRHDEDDWRPEIEDRGGDGQMI